MSLLGGVHVNSYDKSAKDSQYWYYRNHNTDTWDADISITYQTRETISSGSVSDWIIYHAGYSWWP